MLFKDLIRIFLGGNIELWHNGNLVFSGSVFDNNLKNWENLRVLGIMASLTNSSLVVAVKEVE